MASSKKSWLDASVTRFGMMVIATILFNFGLFFILNFLAPFVAGFIIGFLVAKIRDGVVVSFTGTLTSYFIIFTISEWFQGFSSAPLDVFIAILIMVAIGSVGGIIGSLISTKTKN